MKINYLALRGSEARTTTTMYYNCNHQQRVVDYIKSTTITVVDSVDSRIESRESKVRNWSSPSCLDHFVGTGV